MTTTLIEQAVYSGPLVHPDPGDLASAPQLRTDLLQKLADRTRYLVLDAIGARLTTLAPFTIKPSTTDDFSVIVGGPPPLAELSEETEQLYHIVNDYIARNDEASVDVKLPFDVIQSLKEVS